MEVARDEGDKEIKRFCMTSPTCSQFNKNACRMKMLPRPLDMERKLWLSQDTRAIKMEESSVNVIGMTLLRRILVL